MLVLLVVALLGPDCGAVDLTVTGCILLKYSLLAAM